MTKNVTMSLEDLQRLAKRELPSMSDLVLRFNMDPRSTDGGEQRNEALKQVMTEFAFRCIIDMERDLAAKQAEIDRLMLEYCPDEMTKEQIETWGRAQRVAREFGFGDKT